METAGEISYFDNAASTPLCPEAVEAMVPLHRDLYANPTGARRMARDTRRRRVATALWLSLPMIKSPSQWPDSFQSSASAGRLAMGL